jgi:hypothetical protein
MIPTNAELIQRFTAALTACDPLPRAALKDALNTLLILEAVARAHSGEMAAGPAYVHYYPDTGDLLGEDPLGPPDEGGRELTPAEVAWLDEEEARQDTL